MTDTWTVMFDLTDKDMINEEQEYVEIQLKNIISLSVKSNMTDHESVILTSYSALTLIPCFLR